MQGGPRFAYSFQFMTSAAYRLARCVGRIVRNQCVIEFVLNRHRLDRTGGFIVAATHLSHLEPVLISCHARRPITWLARIEFFRHPAAAAALRLIGALAVNRAGVPARSLRRAVELAGSGEIVGIFPEGGVVRGLATIFRGAPFKRGACVIANRARVPILPVIILGTERWNRVAPWLPAKRARVWVAYGRPVEPSPPEMPRRAARFEMADRLRDECVRTYRELLDRTGLSDHEVA